jgi:hypothetical protein
MAFNKKMNQQYNTSSNYVPIQRVNAFVPSWTNNTNNVVTYNPANYSHSVTTVQSSGPNNIPVFTTTHYRNK